MIIKEEIHVRDFEFWGYAAEIAAKIKPEDWDNIDEWLEEFFPNGLTSTELNDLFAYDEEFYEWLQDAGFIPKEEEEED